MKIEDVNSILRETLNTLINSDGYKKNSICSLILGGQQSPMFTKFLLGSEFGIKPLSRIFNSMGCDLMIVPVPKNNTDMQTFLKNTNLEFTQTLTNEIIKYMESDTNTNNTSKNSTESALQEYADGLIEQLLTDVS